MASPIQAASSQDGPKLVAEALQKIYWESLNLLFKGGAYYLAITAALVGYVVTRNLPGPLPWLVLIIALATSLLVLAVGWFCMFGVFRCFTLIEKSMRQMSAEVLAANDIDILFHKGRNTLWAFAIGGTAVIAMFALGIVTLMLTKF